jgi:ribosomal protein S18 acetylase RimI-like enzyme
MSAPLPAWSEAELLAEVFDAPRSATLPVPDTRRIERPGWMQLITPSFRTGGLNEVAFSVLSDDEADAVIDATIAEYRALGIAFRWAVPPGSAPADLGARLIRRGLVESWGRGMARSTAPEAELAAPAEAELAAAPSSDAAGSGDAAASAGGAAGTVGTADDPAIAVAEVTDAASAAAFTRVMAQGWGVDPAPLHLAHERLLADPGRRQRLFLASVAGEPAGAASYVAFPRSAYLLGAVVLPPLRGRGVYRALARARLADARARGIELATCHARESTSAPILERLGFATVRRFAIYFSIAP